MSETDRLRDLLEQTAPRSPDLTAPERAAAVVRRGRAVRRRDQVLVGAATLAVLATALGVPLALGGDEPQEATPAPAPVVVEPCPAAPVDAQTLGPVPALADVVAVRSCTTTGKQVEEPLPSEPLTGEQATAFVADLAAMPDYVIPSMCAVSFIISSPWALQVQTATGDLVMVGGPQRLCSSVRVGGIELAAEQVVAVFRGNLAGTPGSLACPAGDDHSGLPTWNASFDPSTAVAGIVCDGSARVDLTADEVAVIGDDLATNLVAGPDDGRCYDPHPSGRVLLLADGDGDQVAYLGQTCTTQMVSARGYWTPGPVAAQLLNR